jgi:formamidopyrimidine-DNA glycosylase
MLAFWIELKRRAKASWAVFAALVAGALVVIGYALAKKKTQAETHGHLDDLLAKTTERVAAANAQAAIEIHVAETKEVAVRAELTEIGQDPDGDRRRQRLIELAARVEGGKS